MTLLSEKTPVRFQREKVCIHYLKNNNTNKTAVTKCGNCLTMGETIAMCLVI